MSRAACAAIVLLLVVSTNAEQSTMCSSALTLGRGIASNHAGTEDNILQRMRTDMPGLVLGDEKHGMLLEALRTASLPHLAVHSAAPSSGVSLVTRPLAILESGPHCGDSALSLSLALRSLPVKGSCADPTAASFDMTNPMPHVLMSMDDAPSSVTGYTTTLGDASFLEAQELVRIGMGGDAATAGSVAASTETCHLRYVPINGIMAAKAGLHGKQLAPGRGVDTLAARMRAVANVPDLESFDLLFLDHADKTEVKPFVQALLESGLLRPGAVILVDNAGRDAAQLADYASFAQQNPRLRTSRIPMRNDDDAMWFSVVQTVATAKRFLSPLAVASSATRAHINPALWAQLPEMRAQYAQNNFIHYIPDVFTPALAEQLRQDRTRLWMGGMRTVEPACNLDGRDRLGGFVKDSGDEGKHCAVGDGSVCGALYANPGLQTLLSELTGLRRVAPSDMRVELRRYGRGSEGMGWHSDVQLFHHRIGDLELVYTIDNKSPSATEFEDAAGLTRSVRTQANSLIVVQAGAASHRVLPTQNGFRDIVKGVYTTTMEHSDEWQTWGHNACGGGGRNQDGPWTKGMPQAEASGVHI